VVQAWLFDQGCRDGVSGEYMDTPVLKFHAPVGKNDLQSEKMGRKIIEKREKKVKSRTNHANPHLF
jgi:hypothetical protein